MFLTLLFLGMINAVGVQAETSKPAIISYVFVCIPSAWIITFKYHQGIVGLFYGMSIGQTLLSIFYMNIVFNIDWESQMKIIQEQAEQEERKLTEE